MTRRDYLIIASALAATKPQDNPEYLLVWLNTVTELASALHSTNSSFNTDKFLAACNHKEPPAMTTRRYRLTAIHPNDAFYDDAEGLVNTEFDIPLDSLRASPHPGYVSALAYANPYNPPPAWRNLSPRDFFSHPSTYFYAIKVTEVEATPTNPQEPPQ